MITLILATDMARHAEIMDSFKETMENFDYSNEEHMTLVSSFFELIRGWCGSPALRPRLGTEEPRPSLGPGARRDRRGHLAPGLPGKPPASPCPGERRHV